MAIVTTENIHQWNVFVHKCINGDRPQAIIDTMDAVVGPITANAREIKQGYKPKMKKRRRQILLQTAIVSAKPSYTLFEGMKRVIVWGRNDMYVSHTQHVRTKRILSLFSSSVFGKINADSSLVRVFFSCLVFLC